MYKKQALRSTFSGDTARIEAGHALNIIGPNVIGMCEVELYTANNIKQKAVEQVERALHCSVKVISLSLFGQRLNLEQGDELS